MALCHRTRAGGAVLSSSGLIRVAYFLAAIAVGCSAWGTHRLQETADPAALGQWEIGCRFLFWHAIGIWICGAIGRVGQGRLMLLATVLFCGSLLLLAGGGPSLFRWVTPLGGSGLLLSWGWLGVDRGAMVSINKGVVLPKIVE